MPVSNSDNPLRQTHVGVDAKLLHYSKIGFSKLFDTGLDSGSQILHRLHVLCNIDSIRCLEYSMIMNRSAEIVTVTELARNLSSIIDRVRMSSTRVSITCGAQTVAELSPAVQPGMTLGKLLNILQHSTLPEDERQRYRVDLKSVRESSVHQ